MSYNNIKLVISKVESHVSFVRSQNSMSYTDENRQEYINTFSRPLVLTELPPTPYDNHIKGRLRQELGSQLGIIYSEANRNISL